MENRDFVPGLAEKLRKVREIAGLSQVQAAEASGVHVVSINRFEHGERSPSLATLYKLATAYGVAIEELLPASSPTPAPKKGKGGKK